jgi:hypothetical protein
LSEYDYNYSVRSTKVFSVFRLFLDDNIITQGQTMILSSKNNLNIGNIFVDLSAVPCHMRNKYRVTTKAS